MRLQCITGAGMQLPDFAAADVLPSACHLATARWFRTVHQESARLRTKATGTPHVFMLSSGKSALFYVDQNGT